MNYCVLDTNILLLDATNMAQEGVITVLPETVIDEMDNKKSLMGDELGFQARKFARELDKAEVKSVRHLDSKVVTTLSLDGKTIEVCALNSYNVQEGLSYTNDRKILEVAKVYSQDHKAVFMSNDVMARLRAISLGIETKAFNIVEDVHNEFTRTVNVPLEVFQNVNNSKILETIPDHKPGTFNYIISCPDTTHVKLSYIDKGLLKVLGADTEKELRRQDINPMNSQQLFLSRALQDTTIDVVVCEALAGSGKTIVTLSNAIRMVKQGKYKGITYIRHSIDDVPKEEEVGFLSGNDEKMAVYSHPLYDSLDVIVRARLKGKKYNPKELEEAVQKGVQELINDCHIQAISGLGLRGRTIVDDFVIIDEAQNPAAPSMQKTLTRVGKNCKVAVIGSNRQIDNIYTNKHNNGLSYLLEACKADQCVSLYGVDLHKVVRSSIAEFAEKLYSKDLDA